MIGSSPAPALYVIAHADRTAVKIGAVQACANVVSRLEDVSRHHQLRLRDRRVHFPLAFPLELLAMVPLDHPDGVPLWAGRGVCADLLGVEDRTRSIVARQVGEEMPWWEWVRVHNDPGDRAWPELLRDAVTQVRRAAPPMTMLTVLAET